MKTYYNIPLTAVFAISLFLLACKKDENSDSSGQKVSFNAMNYSVDSIYPNGDTTHAIFSLVSSGYLIITGTYGGNGNLSLNLDSSIHVGTYNLDNSLGAIPNMVYTDNQNTEPFFSTSGNITILMHSFSQRQIRGTFSGTVQQPNSGNERVISKGSFWLEY